MEQRRLKRGDIRGLLEAGPGLCFGGILWRHGTTRLHQDDKSDWFGRRAPLEEVDTRTAQILSENPPPTPSPACNRVMAPPQKGGQNREAWVTPRPSSQDLQPAAATYMVMLPNELATTPALTT